MLALGVEYKFSPYGLLSGLLWVTGGACGIFGIRNSGLAISVGTWSSITVLVSFAWGILIFDEQVISVWGTLLGVIMMIFGFIGMAYFSSPQVMEGDVSHNSSTNRIRNEGDNHDQHNRDDDFDQNPQGQNRNGCTANDGIVENSLKEPLLQQQQQQQHLAEDEEGQHATTNIEEEHGEHSGHTSPSTDDETDTNTSNQSHNASIDHSTTVIFLGMKWNRRRLGLLGAVMDGVLGGMMLVPMHFSAYHGEEYIISFGTGAMSITLIFWLIRFAYNVYETKSIQKGYNELPSLHLKTLIIPGGLGGLVWSIGNIGLIFSVSFLGESIGMSIVQSNMIVSGMIGIIWFQEIKGVKPIVFWTLSALLTFVGIIFLSYQHKSS